MRCCVRWCRPTWCWGLKAASLSRCSIHPNRCSRSRRTAAIKAYSLCWLAKKGSATLSWLLRSFSTTIPQIAPESAGDLFDGTEIDEILSLRIMTMTDEEKSEMRQSDERARQMLERTETMPAEQFMKLHGVLRGLRPLKEDSQ